jgi:methyl-accepting chemotaxis protein
VNEPILQALLRKVFFQNLGGSQNELTLLVEETSRGSFGAEGAGGVATGLRGTLFKMRRAMRRAFEGLVTDSRDIAAGMNRISAQANEMALSLQIQSNTNQETKRAIVEIDDNITVASNLARETEGDSRKVVELSHQRVATVNLAAGGRRIGAPSPIQEWAHLEKRGNGITA